MIEAIIRNGAIVPLTPIPADWPDGTKVHVDSAAARRTPTDQIDQDFDELERLCAGNDCDHAMLNAALEIADREAKDWVRREMGLPR